MVGQELLPLQYVSYSCVADRDDVAGRDERLEGVRHEDRRGGEVAAEQHSQRLGR